MSDLSEKIEEARENEARRRARTHVYHPRFGVIKKSTARDHVRNARATEADFFGHPDEDGMPVDLADPTPPAAKPASSAPASPAPSA